MAPLEIGKERRIRDQFNYGHNFMMVMAMRVEQAELYKLLNL